MIDVKELRIGNWVEVSNRKGKVYQYEIGSNDFAELENNSQDFSPIPLTPELLERVGFKIQPQRQSIYEQGRLRLWFASSRSVALSYLITEDDAKTSVYIPVGEIKSLHQLQNLFHSLTATELVVK